MKLKDKTAWDKFVALNQDPYGRGVVEYAERWANLMEEKLLADPQALLSIAESTSHDADTDGITGFMYGCAVSMLAEVWEHGETLRQWHNLKTQIGDEGTRANTEGGVINPALLNLGLPG